MPHEHRGPRPMAVNLRRTHAPPRRRVGAVLLLGLIAGIAPDRPALADEGAPAPAAPGRPSGPADSPAGRPERAETARTSVTTRPRRESAGDRMRWTGGDGRWPGPSACIALVLAACGVAAVVARWRAPRAGSSVVQVVGRVSLSPKQSVYLLRIGRRVLLVGAGPQGPPALIAELDEDPQDPPRPDRGDPS